MPIRDTVCSLCVYLIIVIISHYGFKGGTLVLIASVPGHCLSFTVCG